ncbi:MAG: hypothetical protein JWP94_528 [Mucilaginibacter sp.]|nr:hypothetical protein [Mucilaginibacter sp.]
MGILFCGNINYLIFKIEYYNILFLIIMEFLTKYPNIQVSGVIRANEYCIVDSRVHGLFACFYCILYGLYICEIEDLKPVIVLGNNHLYYQKEYGENIFNYFYEQDEPLTEVTARITVSYPDPFIHWSNISITEKSHANVLINKYFNLKSQFDDALMQFYDKYFLNKRILGVHYRGKDKMQETNLLSFDEYEKRMDFILNNNICDMIFFVSDELRLRDSMADRYKEKLILYPIEGDYSGSYAEDKKGLHFSNTTPYLHAKDALSECYLLALSTMLLSSHNSSMSLYATFFNPELLHLIIEP